MLGQVGLDALDAGRGQGVRRADLLAEHRLAARHPARARLPADREDNGAGLVSRCRPMDLGSHGGRVALEELEIVVEVGDHVVLDPPCRAARAVSNSGNAAAPPLRALALGGAGGPVDGDLEGGVRECCAARAP